MFRRITLSFILAGSLFSATSEAATWVINCDNTKNFPNIGAALASTAPKVLNGDTLVVEPCTIPPFAYPGAVINNWVDLHLVAADAFFRGARAEGVGAAPAAPVVIDPSITGGTDCLAIINSIDVSIHGFTLRNCNGHGVHMIGSQNLLVEGNVINNTFNTGVFDNGSFSSRITGNTISNTGGHGVHLIGPDETLVADNAVANSTSNGIFIESGYHTKVFNNTVDASGLVGIEVNVGPSSQHRLERNTVTLSGVSDLACAGPPLLDVIGNTYAGFFNNLCFTADIY